MIRRGFWLAAGAVLGVTGYRKASRLVQSLTGQQRRRPAQAVLTPAARAALRATTAPRLALTGTAETARAAHPGSAERAARVRAGTVTALARAASAAEFVRDVREGMAEYRDLHRGELDHTLGSRSDRGTPAASRQGRLES